MGAEKLLAFRRQIVERFREDGVILIGIDDEKSIRIDKISCQNQFAFPDGLCLFLSEQQKQLPFRVISAPIILARQPSVKMGCGQIGDIGNLNRTIRQLGDNIGIPESRIAKCIAVLQEIGSGT